jgi:hypothetical protein
MHPTFCTTALFTVDDTAGRPLTRRLPRWKRSLERLLPVLLDVAVSTGPIVALFAVTFG